MPALKPDKGRKGGSCNFTACQRPGATWFHHSTEAWYCERCARELNQINRLDAAILYGHGLLTPTDRKVRKWGEYGHFAVYTRGGHLLRRNFYSVEEARTWADTSPTEKLRLFYVPAEVRWGKDWCEEKDMRRMYGANPEEIVTWATERMGMDITVNNVFEGVIQ